MKKNMQLQSNNTPPEATGVRDVILTVKVTKTLPWKGKISEAEYLALQGQTNDETPVLNELYEQAYVSEDAETERDYSLYDVSTDKLIVEMDE